VNEKLARSSVFNIICMLWSGGWKEQHNTQHRTIVDQVSKQAAIASRTRMNYIMFLTAISNSIHYSKQSETSCRSRAYISMSIGSLRMRSNITKLDVCSMHEKDANNSAALRINKESFAANVK
jgi:hypothetical protein